jgi:hypothetical protein
MKYLVVYVAISPARDGGFDVTVASDAGGEGNSILKLPFAMDQLSGVMFNVEHGARKIGTVTPQGQGSGGTATSFGVALFEALFQGETREVLSRTESEAKRRRDTGVRIRLSMNLAAEGMAEVASLPWELMRRRDQQPLVVSVQTPVVRAFDTPKPIILQALKGNLRILAIISNPTGTAALNLEEEKKRIGKIWATLDNVEVDFVRPVEEEILNHLAQHDYHVIHYMGHGDFDSGAGGLLMMEHNDGSAHLIGGDTFAAWLQDDPVRLVFLNACNTGTTGQQNGLHPFAGVASALIRNGLPAVVAMQFPISDGAAIIFAETFYQRIAQGFPVDAAVGDGRKRLLSSPGAEWATPVLYMRAPDGDLFSKTSSADESIPPGKRVAQTAHADTARPSAPDAPAAVKGDVPPDREAAPEPTAGGRAQAPVSLLSVGGGVPQVPWYRKNPALGCGCVAAILVGGFVLLIMLGAPSAPSGTGEQATTATPASETTPAAAPAPGLSEDPNNPATAVIAKIPDALWINDYADKTSVADKVLKNLSFEKVEALSDAGNHKAQYVIAEVYRRGLAGRAAAEQYAPSWYVLAAEAGLPVAQFWMGDYSARGLADKDGVKGVEKNKANALEWFKKAAAQGNLAAANAVAHFDEMYPPK